MRKSEIEDFLKGKGDFVQIDHLTRFLKSNVPMETKKFIYQKLSELYEKRGMLTEAAKMQDNAAIASLPTAEKLKLHIKETELYIQAGQFTRADEAMKKIFTLANATERNEIYIRIKEFYKKQAAVYDKEKRRNNAAKMYEKVLEMKISEGERQEIKEKLLVLYEQLGRVREYMTLKNSR